MYYTPSKLQQREKEEASSSISTTILPSSSIFLSECFYFWVMLQAQQQYVLGMQVPTSSKATSLRLKKWPHTTTTFKCFPSQQQVLLDFYGLGNHKLHYPSFKLTYPKKFEIALPFQTITKRYSKSKIYRSITCCCNF